MILRCGGLAVFAPFGDRPKSESVEKKLIEQSASQGHQYMRQL